MDRINSVGTVLVGGIRQWINKNLLGGIPGTQTNATYENDMQEELVHGIIEASGQTPTAGAQNQVAGGIGLMYCGALVGTARNAGMVVPGGGSTIAFVADELVVSKSLGGFSCKLGNFNEPLNLATVGVGGMDTGSPPASGFVAIYAIYNPTTGAAALLATNATSAVAPEVYGGAYMPAGYTYSALVSVWPTDGSGHFVVGVQEGRKVSLAPTGVLATSTNAPSLTALTISNVPLNATSFSGWVDLAASGSGVACDCSLAMTSSAVGELLVGSTLAASTSTVAWAITNYPIIRGTRQVYYTMTNLSSSLTSTIACSGYEF